MTTSADKSMRQRGVDLHQRVKEFLPKIANNARQAEQLRMVPEENITLLKQAGFTRAFQPQAFGGLEISVEQYGPIMLDLAYACGSTAWAAGLLAQHAHLIALMSPQLQQDIWADDTEQLVSSSVAPIMQAEEVDGGIVLTGEFGWSSGCDHAQWAILGCRRRVKEFPDMPLPFFAVVPKVDYQIIDDWQTAGLRGTGSKTLKLDGVFVPEHRTDCFIPLGNGQSKGFGSNPSEIYHAPFRNHFSLGFSAVSLGIAKRFLDLYREKTATRVRAYTGSKAAESVPSYMRLSESALQLRAAESAIKLDWQQIAQACAQRRMPTPNEDATWRSNQSWVTSQAIDAVNRLHTASGGSAWFDDNDLQRLWRDSKITGAHAYSDIDMAHQSYGRFLMELDFDMSIF